jgi:glycine oxidase
VVIVGGGLIGASIAWRLAQRGARVEVVEAGKFGNEASRAGAGMLAPGGEMENESVWARRAVASLAMYPAFVEELTAATGVEIDFRLCGAQEWPESPDGWDALRQRAERQVALGIRSYFDGDCLRYPDDAIVRPKDVLAALRAALEALGVTLREFTRVARVEPRRVWVGEEVRECGTVVLAAGAWSSELMPAAPRAFPVKGHLIGYHVEPGLVGPIQRRGHHYVLQRNSGFLIAGTTSEHVGFDRSINPATVAEIHRQTKALWPQLPDAPDTAWIGFRPGVEGEPRVEPWSDGLWLAYGHYRNGILLAPVTAQIVADALA